MRRIPGVVLTASNLGDVSESEFNRWINFVADRIGEAVGFEVDIEAFSFNHGEARHRISANTSAEHVRIREALDALWDEWCAGECAMSRFTYEIVGYEIRAKDEADPYRWLPWPVAGVPGTGTFPSYSHARRGAIDAGLRREDEERTWRVDVVWKEGTT